MSELSKEINGINSHIEYLEKTEADPSETEKVIQDAIDRLNALKIDVPEQKTEVYSRVVGYYRSVDRWNDGKRQEFDERKEYEIEHSKAPEKEKTVKVA